MKQITKYVSDDGVEFTDESACLKYEQLCFAVALVMEKLAPIPALPSCAFANGAGYIQHDPEIAKNARKALLILATGVVDHKWIQQTIDDDSIHPSYAGRIISESDAPCLRIAFDRFMCMTPDFREYGQPYYAANPEKAKDVCLNGVQP